MAPNQIHFYYVTTGTPPLENFKLIQQQNIKDHPAAVVYFYLFIFLVFLLFLGPLLWHMEVPRLGI